MPYVDAGGVRLHHQILNPTGSPTVVAIHGLNSNQSVFLLCGAAALVSRGYRVVLFDLPGHGLTDGTGRGFRLAVLSQVVLDLMDALRIDQATLMGYSLGGAVAVQTALQAPWRVSRLVLIEATGLARADLVTSEDSEQAAKRHLAHYAASTGLSISERAVQQARERAVRLRDAGLYQALQADADFFRRVDATAITQPVLLVYGTRSPYLADGRLLAVGLPRATFHVMEGDHNIVVVSGAEVALIVAEFCGPGDLERGNEAPGDVTRTHRHDGDDEVEGDGSWP